MVVLSFITVYIIRIVVGLFVAGLAYLSYKGWIDVLKAQINSTNLAHTGQVENLINKVYYYEGEVSAVGGGTWTFLHDVQDTLLAKIKATGQSGFTAAELAAIDSFGNDVATSKQEHPSSNVFG